MLRSTSICHVIIISFISLPTTAILIYNGQTVTNQRIETPQGSEVQITCGGGSNPTWKKGAGHSATSLPAGVTQTEGDFSTLTINSLTSANMGVYSCLYGPGASSVDTVTISIGASTQSPIKTGMPTTGSTPQTTQVSTTQPPPPRTPKVQGVTVARTVLGSSPALRVSWSAVSGSGITYTVCYSTTSGTSNANCDTSKITSTSTTLGPLSRGTIYYIWVAAVLSGGRGPYSDRSQLRTLDYAPAPPSVTASPLPERRKIRVSWTPPTPPTGSTITGYSIQYRIGSSGDYTTATDPGRGSTSITISGLQLGRTYQVRVGARTGIGVRTRGYRTAQVTTFNYAPAPPTVTASPLSERGKIRVSWTAPTPPTGSSITGYYISYRILTSSMHYVFAKSVGSASTSTTISGLQLGRTYQVRVGARTEIGVSLSSYQMSQTTTYNVPRKIQALPLQLSESGNNLLSLTATWSAPQSDIPITRYEGNYRTLPSGRWTGAFSTQTTQHIFKDLMSGKNFEVRVRAVSAIGGGPNATNQTSVPTKPNVTRIKSKQHRIELTWTSKGADEFVITYSRAKPISNSRVQSITTRQSVYNVTELESNTAYAMTISARNTQGTTNSTEIRGYTTPEAPLVTLTTLSSTSIKVQWTPPPNSDRLPLTYHVNYTGMSRSTTSTTLTLTGLHPYEEYAISVQAGNRAELSVPVTGTARTYSDAPTGFPSSFTSVNRGAIWVYVSWSIPQKRKRNGVIISYKLLMPLQNVTITVNLQNPTFDTPSTIHHNITGLSPGTEYTVRVAASTVNGTGPFGEGSMIRTKDDLPGPVSNLTFTASSSTVVKVFWEEPKNPNGIIVKYSVIYKVIDGNRSVHSTSNSKMVTLQDLEKGIPYIVTVRAYTSMGAGENASIVVFSGEVVPSKPVENIVTEWKHDGSILVRWTPLSYKEARGLPFYIIIYEALDGSSRGNTTSTDDSVIIFGLNTQIGYNITVEVTTDKGANRGNHTLKSITISPQDSFPVGAVVGVLLAIISIGALVAAVVVIYLCCKRSQVCASCQSPKVSPKPSRKKKKKVDMYEMQPPPEEIYYLSLQVGSMEPIPQSRFSIHVKAMHMERDSGFEREFQTIANDPDGSEEIAKENRPKNRYLNIHTFDHSRVVLSGDEKGDYINASFIDGYNRSNAYIASQGPLPDTIADFWEMVWEQRSPVIVMLTKLEEKGKVKCEKYWNDELDTPYDLSRNLTVTTRSYKAMADYEIRDIRVVKANGSHNKPLDVVQMQYNGWPDYGVPSHPSSLVKYVQQVRKEYKNSTAPMLVHCSAGVGRTGTFITIDAMLKRLQENGDLNIYQFVTAMRTKRTFMVQTMDQYAFIHDALNDHLTCGDTSVPAHHLRSVIVEMSGPGQETSCTGFQEQFEFLDSLCKTTCDEDDTYSRKGTITKKNRYSDKFPYSHNHLKLHSKSNTNGGDYINASFVDSYSKSKAFIAAQAPLENTRNDIWQLIWQYKMPTVVVLCDFQEDNEETCSKFWPDDTIRSIEYDYLKVNHKDVSHADTYEMVKLDVFDRSMESKVHNVTLFHTKNWPKNGLVDPNSVLKLMGDVEGAHGGKKKPILVLCNDGMGRSGVFICAMSEVERVKVEGQVDVFQTVKAIRTQRPHMVDTPEQYKLCFEILLTHLDSFDTYANFKAV